MRIEESAGYRRAIPTTDIRTCKEMVKHLCAEFGPGNVECCDEISHPREGQLVDIPDDREIADENPDYRIVPAGKYRVVEILGGGVSSHNVYLEELGTGKRAGGLIARHGAVTMDWRDVKKIAFDSLSVDTKPT